MATYKGIKGFKVKNVTASPSPLNEGQVWYNTTADTLNYATVSGVPAGTWASSNPINRGSSEAIGCAQAAPMTTSLIFGGFSAPQYPPGTNAGWTEQYDGTSWATKNNLPAGRAYLGGLGTSTTAICVGGYPYPGSASTTAFNFDGTNWTAGVALASAFSGGASWGTSTAAVVAGGDPPSGPTGSQIWNGTSWTVSGAMSVGRTESGAGGCGLSTAGIITGGTGPSTAGNVTEFYNGSTWSTASGSITAPAGLRSGFMFGDQATAMYVGGYIGPTYASTNQIYDGSAWAEGSDIANGRRNGGRGGGTISGLIAGGAPSTPPIGTFTEEWSAPAAAVVKTVTVS